MRKAILLLSLILVMVSSVVAGTLAMYTVKIDNVADGSVVAKEFIFIGEGTDSFQHGIKIAPTERIQWQFKVKNFKNQIITETDLYYKLTFKVASSPGKNAINPLNVTVKDMNGNVINSVTGVGTFDIMGSFPLASAGQEKSFVLELYWPSGPNDMQYAGSHFGTSINVDAVASQVPLSGTEPPPQPSGKVQVKYATSVPWQNGQSQNYQYEYKVSITNNTSKPINNWNLGFSLYNDRINNVWSNAKMVSYTPPGHYYFLNPAYNNPATDHILPGQTVWFRGLAHGQGKQPIHNVMVGGSNTPSIIDIDLSIEYNKPSLD